MRAVVSDGVGRVAVVDLPDPELTGPDQAIVRITRTAICGSDLHLVHGKAPIDPGEPLGHEAVGVVEAVGDEVARLRPGDRVAVAFNVACGHCWFCGTGQSGLCEDGAIFGYGVVGGAMPGAQAERLRVPAADVNLLPIPGVVSDDAAVFVGDVLSTGFHGASLAGAGPGSVVAVLGCGPVGLCTVLALRSLGVGSVYAIDREPARLALAAAAGATPVHVDERNASSALAEATDGRGADAVIDVVGHPSAFDDAIGIVRRGGTVAVVGVYAAEVAELQLGTAWSRALTFRFAGLTPVVAWWERAMAALELGEIDPSPIISHRLPLEAAAEGYALFDRREATKVVLEP
ncbi:MAG TPA: alcohol dehydrogenase catalytic domain-containing protein [Actinomycetota bacterium]|nr:alcohol dehydrogenase catalytic domain-containing protein [Actinomycetota bacterium]